VPEPKDSFREVVETIVFVVVLVLLLKSFLAEAFVIPTGSMATTLLGYHREVTCPQCTHQFKVNASKEVDAQEMELQPITGCTCPNCRFHIELRPRNVERMLQP
jgi:signal peptidase I